MLNIPLSNASSIHCKTSFEAKFISSNNNGYPYLNAVVKGPSIFLIPANDFSSPIYEPNKSCTFVSWDKLNLNNFLFFLSFSFSFNFSSSSNNSHIISILNVFDVPVCPSNNIGIPFVI